jgi:hypothetical protein
MDWCAITLSVLLIEPLEDARESLSRRSFVEFFSRESTFLFQEESKSLKLQSLPIGAERFSHAAKLKLFTFLTAAVVL